jgi:hypothetical protein
MSKQQTYDRLDREAERIARKVDAALRSYRLAGDGFADDIPDVATLWETIGRRLVEYECAANDQCPSGQMEYMALATLKALDRWHEARGASDAAAQERREAVKTLLRLATVDGRPVAP